MIFCKHLIVLLKGFPCFVDIQERSSPSVAQRNYDFQVVSCYPEYLYAHTQKVLEPVSMTYFLLYHLITQVKKSSPSTIQLFIIYTPGD